VVTFTTSNPVSVALDKSDAMTFYRLVPASWDFVSAGEGSAPLSGGSSISPAATTVTITADANLEWWGRVGSDGTKIPTTGAVTGYESKSVDVGIIARPADVAASWNEDETVSVQAGYDAREGIAAQIKKELSLVRPPYAIEVTEAKPVYNSVTLTVVTDALEFYLELRDENGTLVGELEGKTGSGDYKVSLALNKGDSERPVTVTNKYKPEPSLITFGQPVAPAYILLEGVSIPLSSSNWWPCPDEYTWFKPWGSVWYIYSTDGLLYNGKVGIVQNISYNNISFASFTIVDGVITEKGSTVIWPASTTLAVLCKRN
jgi:hypothetical protein